jgi:hypothetical protein
LNIEFVSGVSLETLGAMLASSIFLADFALSEASVLRVVANSSGQGESALNERRRFRAYGLDPEKDDRRSA